MAGNRTRIDRLEGDHANRYTTIADDDDVEKILILGPTLKRI